MHRVIHSTEERHEIVVLLPNSKHIKGNNRRNADAHGSFSDGRLWLERLFKLLITSKYKVLVDLIAFFVRMNIYQIWRNFPFCSKSASHTA